MIQCCLQLFRVFLIYIAEFFNSGFNDFFLTSKNIKQSFRLIESFELLKLTGLTIAFCMIIRINQIWHNIIFGSVAKSLMGFTTHAPHDPMSAI
jgi:hypothetical protein